MLTTLEKNVRENLKHNITVNLWDGGLFGAAIHCEYRLTFTKI